MLSSIVGACKNLSTIAPQFPVFHFHVTISQQIPSSTSLPFGLRRHRLPCIYCSCNRKNGDRDGGKREDSLSRRGGGGGRVKVKGRKENHNVWSIDNQIAEEIEEKEREGRGRGRGRRRRGERGKRRVMKSKGSRVLVTGPMLMEVDTALQTQEPVIRPAWNTFASSVCGIWKGVGAVFSPITAEMEPVDIGRNDEYLYDCYTLSRIETMPAHSAGKTSQIRRKVNWATLNPFGESQQQTGKHESASSAVKDVTDMSRENNVLPSYESFDLVTGDLMEEDVMDMEPGLVFFEDGSYSRGPVDIPISKFDGSNYFISPTYKFEQCLVKGCHRRLRIVHTIEFGNGGADIQLLRVAVYEEQWVSPASIEDHSWNSDVDFDLKPFSQRKRIHPSDLSGFWKVFEMRATPIDGDEMTVEGYQGTSYVYICMETLKKRSLPESQSYFGEENMLDVQDVTVLWLPGGVTGYVDVDKDGTLTIGVGWYSYEGINLVMERDYGTDGKLKEVRWKSEVKRRWSGPFPV